MSPFASTADAPVRAWRERDRRNHFVSLPYDAVIDGFNEALSWDDFDWVRATTTLPLILKGVTCPEDAVMGVERGASVVYVSNHGRQLDHLPSTIEVLPEIVSAVGGRADIVIDSGFVHGSDLVKELALGARAVVVGKVMLWGLGAAGEEGLSRALEIIREETDRHGTARGTQTVGADEDAHPCNGADIRAAWVGFLLKAT